MTLFISYHWTSGLTSRAPGTSGFSNLVDDFEAPCGHDDIKKMQNAIRDARFPGRDVQVYILNWKVL